MRFNAIASKNLTGSTNSSRPAHIVRRLYQGSGSRSREARSNDRWVFRPCGIEWYKRRFCMFWNRSLTPRFRNTATGSGTDEGVTTLSDESKNYSKLDTSTWSMQTSRADSDTISKPRLTKHLREKVSDSRVLELVKMYLKQGVMEGLRSGRRKRALRRARSYRHFWQTFTSIQWTTR